MVRMGSLSRVNRVSKLGALLLALVPSCSGERPVVVGSKNFTEQVILGEVLAQLLEARDVPVERRLNLGGTFICHRALLAGDLDVYVEYTGTALTAVLKEKVSRDADAVYQRVREVYRKDLGLAWTEPLGFDNTFAIAMTPEAAAELGIRTISDLKLEKPPRGIELGLIYQALMEGEVDVVVGSATDGLIDKFGLTVLEDDRFYFPPYDAAAVYRPSTAEREPALAEVLELLEGNLDEAAMRGLNRQVDDEGRAAAEVVASFLRERGWLGQDSK